MKTIEELRKELKECEYGKRWECLSAQISCLEAARKVADDYLSKKAKAG